MTKKIIRNFGGLKSGNFLRKGYNRDNFPRSLKNVSKIGENFKQGEMHHYNKHSDFLSTFINYLINYFLMLCLIKCLNIIIITIFPHNFVSAIAIDYSAVHVSIWH